MPAPAAYRPHAHTSHNGHATAPACLGARPTRRPYPNNPPARLRPAVQAALSVLSVAACGLAAVSAGLPLPARAQAASPAASEAATPQSWQLPAGPLAPALRALAAQANLLLSFTEAQTAGKTTSGLSGRHTPQAALHALLAGTGLQAAPLPGGGYTLRAAPASTAAVPAPARPSAPAAPAAMPGAAQTLPAVTVTAAPDLSGTTEGTRSFTTRAMSSATGLALSPRQTPQSVSVITRERIEAQGMSSLSDAVAATPGVYTAPYDG
ncbi:MAG: secretin and TonB N-terminal domain-containing protein, partial [Comamonadaceae bacterium]|nr:secretin and TonB N-terminal domain-containing protein [Comamonadaceae bacterium]